MQQHPRHSLIKRRVFLSPVDVREENNITFDWGGGADSLADDNAAILSRIEPRKYNQIRLHSNPATFIKHQISRTISHKYNWRNRTRILAVLCSGIQLEFSLSEKTRNCQCVFHRFIFQSLQKVGLFQQLLFVVCKVLRFRNLRFCYNPKEIVLLIWGCVS
jgi:hypothetical protein